MKASKKRAAASPSGSRGPISGILQEMTIDDFRDWKPEVVLAAIGSTEPHGPHLPYGTDTYAVEEAGRHAVERANALGGRVLQYPTLPVGCNANFKAFPFACRLKITTLMQVLLDIVEALEEDGIRKIVVMNGHGGNSAALQAALRAHFDRHPGDPRGRRAFVCMIGSTSFADAESRKLFTHSSPHGGESETAKMLHLKPGLVRKQYLDAFPMVKPSVPALAEAESKVHFVRPWHLFLPRGAGGETRYATAAMGKAAFESNVKGLADFLVALSRAPWHPDFPYAPESSAQKR